MISLELFGGCRLNAGTIDIKSAKGRALVAYLGLNPAGKHDREFLAGLLWGDTPEANARASLRQVLLELRRASESLSAPLVDVGEHAVSLSAGVKVDVHAFEEASRQGHDANAAQIFQGELLAGVAAISDPFDEWLSVERTRLHAMASDVLERLGTTHLNEGDHATAIQAARRLVDIDPLRESGHRLLMRGYAEVGRRAEAIAQFDRLTKLLEAELEVPPDPESTALADKIRSAHPITLGAASRSAKPSLLVLPFLNMSNDEFQEYLADGITDDVITGLSKSRMLAVVSRNTSFRFKGENVEVQKIAREMGAQYVVEGSIRRDASRIRITAQLIDAKADNHIWAGRYDDNWEDVFAIQDTITDQIIATIVPAYLTAERRRSRNARNADAWDHFMRAYWLFARFTLDDLAQAVTECSAAIDAQPDEASYHGLLATIRIVQSLYGWESPVATHAAAREAALRAIAIDDSDPLACRSMGLVSLHGRQHEDAIHYFGRAVELDPYEAENLALLGNAYGLSGDYATACRLVDDALAMSPHDAFVASWYGYLAIAALIAEQHEEALGLAEMSIRANPAFPGGHRSRAAALALLGRSEDAREAIGEFRRLLPNYGIADLRGHIPIQRPEHLEYYLEGLRLAGLD